MAEQWQIKGKHCVVTGGASGLGAKKVECLLDEGAAAIIIFDINENRGKAAVETHNQTHPGVVTYIRCDMADEGSVTRAFDQALDRLKTIDVIINNAGILDETLQNWQKTVDVNVKGVISMTYKGIEHMRKDRGGSGGAIANVSSVGAFMETSCVPIYCATKSAVMWFGRCISDGDFYERTGVRILTICYGATNTEILNVQNKTYDENYTKIFLNILDSVTIQTVESGANSCIEMIKKGACGSIWLSQDNDPAQDITSAIGAAYKTLDVLIKKI